ncbi:MAG: V-type ATP synthase subunit E family protein [Spirochaetia bacterium]
MAEQNEDAKQIIDGILEDARGEAEKIRREAESRVEDRRMLLSGRVQRIKDDAVGEAKRRAEEIRRRTDAEISRAQRRNDLARRRDVIAAVEGEVHRRFEALSRGEAAGGVPGARDYTQVLTGWIVEGAIGLEGTRFTVSAGAGETSTVESLIADAERKATELSGREIHLDVAEQPHGETPGVIISSPDGRTIYDNRINARMRRHQSEIRGIIYETLFSEDSTAGGASAGSEAGGDGDDEDRGDDAHGADV